MSDKIIFYTNPRSRSRIVRWMLEEVEQPYETEVIEYMKIKDKSYLAVNPMGKVPALKHGDTVITETAAICAYLADAFPKAGLAPAPKSRLRGTYYRWMFFAAGPIEAAANNRALGVVVPPGREKMLGYGTYENVMNTLECALSNKDYIVGDAFTAADVYIGSQIGFGLQFGTIDKRPVFERYWSRICVRPAAIRARKIDDELAMAQQKAQAS